MSIFSKDPNAHPNPNSLRLKEALGRCGKPAPPAARRAQGKNCKKHANSKRMQFVTQSVPREPWFGRGKNAAPNALLSVEAQEQKRPTSAGRPQDFKSVALAAEWKFREAKNMIELRGDEATRRKPDTDFVKTCLAVLGDLAPACGPIRRLLAEITEDLARHIFLDYHEPYEGASKLRERPFFVENETLAGRLADITDQRNRLREQLVSEVKNRRSIQQSAQRLRVELADAKRTLHEAKGNIVNIARVAEHARDNYHRIRDEHEEITKELQAVNKSKNDLAAATHQQITIYQVRLTQLSNELNKALQELTQKNAEINRLRIAR